MGVTSTVLKKDPEADPPEFAEECAPRPNDVGFTAAVIGLAAKMAKADGHVSEAELHAAAERVAVVEAQLQEVARQPRTTAYVS